MSCCSRAEPARLRRLPPLLAVGLVAVVVVVPASGAARASTTTASWQPHVNAARAYAQRRKGVVNFAVRTPTRLWGWHRTDDVPSASVVKALLLVTYLNDPRVRNRRLRAADRRLLDPMIQRSDNAAASAVLAYVGAPRVRAAARAVGMRRFELGSYTWGASRIDASDQTRFFLHIDQRIPRRHRATAMWLLRTVVSYQRWGIGQLKLPGWKLYFKGGWGAGTGAVDHQVALLRKGGRRISVAVLTNGSPSHTYAQETLRGVFARLLSGLTARSR